MSTGFEFKRVGVAFALSLAVLCAGNLCPANAAQAPQRRLAKSKAKKQELPPLPSGPTGPVQAMPLDTIAAVPPQVSFENNQLTIVAPNSTLGDILRAVRKSTGAEIDVPTAPERVVTHLGPGPAREIVADLLNGSRFNYVLLGAPGDDTALTRVVLVAKTANEGTIPNQPAPVPQPGMAQVNSLPPQPQEAPPPDENDQPTADENNAVDDNAEQPPPESTEQPPNPDQPQVKTPQQMLQEMQQRQMQLQQGRPEQGPPGSGTQPHPPEER
jgi:hypothetical protein